jgi:hypothetical protein
LSASRPDAHTIECEEFVQLTYDQVRTGPSGDEIAYFDSKDDVWRLQGELNHLPWSDIVITTKEHN